MAPNRYYTSDAVATTLAAPLSSVTPGTTGQAIELESITGYPTEYPFTLLLDWGTASQEVATVTGAATGSGPYVFTGCVRGDDGSLAPAHSSGATVEHGVSARDFAEPQAHINGFTQGMAPSGITGATAASRYVGATASGAPVSGTFEVGDYVVDQTGAFWLCTTAGSPGTWAEAGGYAGDLDGGSATTGQQPVNSIDGGSA